MADRAVTIFTFTKTEADAVQFLLNGYIDRARSDSPPWYVPGLGEKRIVRQRPDGLVLQIEHRSLMVQGNVRAGAALAGAAADAFADRDSRGGDDYESRDADDYYVFYGCCGVLDEAFVGQVFRVSRVAYMSLGSVTNRVDAGGGEAETVRLKNKWFVRTDPDDQPPLSSVFLPLGSKERSGKLMYLDLPEAFVLATDKVIKVAPAATAPAYEWSDPAGGAVYRRDEWTYAQALAHGKNHVEGPVLVDMETFGIASVMAGMGLHNRVLVLRVGTDALTTKDEQSDPEQGDLLRAQLPALSAALTLIME